MAVSAERELIKIKFERSLHDSCDAFKKMTPIERETIVRRVERSCFNTSITKSEIYGIITVFTDKKFLELYSMECSRILHNIAPATAYNSYLVDKLIDGTINLNTVAELKNDELNPDVSAAEREEIRIRQCQKTERKVSHKYTCKKCGGNKTIPLEYQGHASDEASSHSIKCIGCENVWRSH